MARWQRGSTSGLLSKGFDYSQAWPVLCLCLWLWLYAYHIIHCERDRGICAHRINKTCFVTQPRHRHRRLAWLDSGLRLCMTMSMTTTSATSTSTTTTTATPTHTARVRCLCMHRRSICYAIIYALDIAICHTIT